MALIPEARFIFSFVVAVPVLSVYQFGFADPFVAGYRVGFADLSAAVDRIAFAGVFVVDAASVVFVSYRPFPNSVSLFAPLHRQTPVLLPLVLKKKVLLLQVLPESRLARLMILFFELVLSLAGIASCRLAAYTTSGF